VEQHEDHLPVVEWHGLLVHLEVPENEFLEAKSCPVFVVGPPKSATPIEVVDLHDVLENREAT
jgi:hypothetical protein